MSIQDQQLDELREALKELREDSTVDNTGAVSGTVGYDSVLSADTVTLNGTNYSNTVTSGGFTLGSTYLAPGYSTSVTGINWNTTTASVTAANPWATTTQTGRMELNGDAADLVINGVSLLSVLQDRLNVMIPNPALEAEWTELRELGDQYRKLEAKLKEQGDMWAKLKRMPPPEPL